MGVIEWNVDHNLIDFGGLSIRYYSLLFAGGLFLGYFYVKRILLKEGWSIEAVDKLALYIFVGTVLGARIGHCVFYEPETYLHQPWKILLPFEWGQEGFRFTGFTGLASHGGILAVFIAIWWFCKKFKKDVFSVLDKVSIGGALAAVFIRLGNFMNSEILGKPTEGDYGVLFRQASPSFLGNVPRHPSQLYESFAYLLIFLILAFLYRKYRHKFGTGFLFGLFFTLLFMARFLIEFTKENQVAFEDSLTLNMGQLLSIPFMLFGLIVMFIKYKGHGKTVE